LDVKKRFSEEQIIGFLREADKGVAVKDGHPQVTDGPKKAGRSRRHIALTSSPADDLQD
jgi:hypothetical protein